MGVELADTSAWTNRHKTADEMVTLELLWTTRDLADFHAARRKLEAVPQLHVGRRVAEVPVCHYDRDFELIAAITGQPVRAIAPLGSL